MRFCAGDSSAPLAGHSGDETRIRALLHLPPNRYIVQLDNLTRSENSPEFRVDASRRFELCCLSEKEKENTRMPSRSRQQL